LYPEGVILPVSLVLCCALEAGSAPDAQTIVLVRDSIPRLPIRAGSTRAPALELKRYLDRIAGSNFQILPPAKGQAGIHVGLLADFPWRKFDHTGELGREGFLIESDGESLFIAAREERGVSHGVMTFLHHLGCRWFFPGPVWEVIPGKKTLAGAWSERQIPAFETQRTIWYGYGAYRPGKEALEDWNRHNRMGGPIKIAIGHTWYGLHPEKDFQEHPEWFALVQGKRQPSKPCYSSPAVLERAVEYALKQAERGADMISLSPPDGLGYCECSRCMAVLEGGEPFQDHKTTFGRRPDGTLVSVTSETLFSLVNRVAGALSGKFPETIVGCYAYSAYSHPPSFSLHPGVYLQVTSAYRRTPISLEEQLRQFGKKTRQLGIREYFSVFQWDWDYPDPGKLEPGALQETLQFYRRMGVTAVNAEASCNWAPRGLGYYLASRLMWNVDVDVKAAMVDFYEKCFGPAALPAQRYFARFYGPGAFVLEDPRGAPARRRLRQDGKIRVEVLKAAYRDLDDATRLTREAPSCRARIDQLRLYAHYLLLRYRLQEEEMSGDEQRILDAIRAETVFAGRLTNTHLIHSRALIGKAFLRRFRGHSRLLERVPEARAGGEGWRRVGEPPAPEELEELWARDRSALGLE